MNKLNKKLYFYNQLNSYKSVSCN